MKKHTNGKRGPGSLQRMVRPRGFATLDASGFSVTLIVPLSSEVFERMTTVSELARGVPNLGRVLKRLVSEITDKMPQEIEAVSCRMLRSACVDGWKRYQRPNSEVSHTADRKD